MISVRLMFTLHFTCQIIALVQLKMNFNYACVLYCQVRNRFVDRLSFYFLWAKCLDFFFIRQIFYILGFCTPILLCSDLSAMHVRSGAFSVKPVKFNGHFA